MTSDIHSAQPQPERRIIVVSDLHMTAGRSPDTGVWSPTEDFFQDDEFTRFLEHYSHGPATTLVINGDLFDFLQVLEFPEEWKKDRGKGKPDDHIYMVERAWRGRTFHYCIPLADINPTYGLRCTKEATRFLAGTIVEGHEQFFQALADFVVHDEHRVVILKGNHDIQLFWSGVQEELYRRMECLVPDGFVPAVRERITFKPWFHYEPGLAWIEHGNQYEYTTSFVNFLAPVLPFAYDETGSAASGTTAATPGTPSSPSLDDGHIELDLASFLVRYLTNPGESVNPLADNIRPLARYWEAMWREHPFFVLGTFRAGVVFMMKAFAKSAQMRRKTGWTNRTMSDANRTMMADAARHAGLPIAVLEAIDACKAEPTMAYGPLRVLWWFLRPIVAGMLWLLPLTIVVSNVTTWIPDPVGSGGWLARTFTTLLQGAIVVTTGALLIGARQWYRRMRATWRRATAREARNTAEDKAQSSPTAAPPQKMGVPQLDMRTIATYIATLTDVPFVAFGHTHYADLHTIGENRWYFNSGTWMTILEPREQLYREARQLTFIEINAGANREPTATLLCWYPPQSAPRPVVIVDLGELDDGVENGIVMSMLKKFGSAFGGGS